MFQEDTIAAIATAVGEGGIGIVRLSGSGALEIAGRIFKGIHGREVKDITSYQAAYGHIIDPDSRRMVDEVILLVMRGPASYTKEDVIEIHCHGGPIPLKNILALTLRMGARLAEPGEFTKRAFLNGRLDLAQAEAVIDVIRAKTDISLKMAMNHLTGNLSRAICGLRHNILELIAQLEAAIDFPEDDIEEVTAGQVDVAVRQILATLVKMMSTAQTGRILREGLETVIIGKPNVGKSSLLNALLGENRAIVTEIPGTTRDSIEEYINIRGIPLKVIDTAGIRDTNDKIEQIGVDKAREIMNRAGLILLMLDASRSLSAEDREVLGLIKEQPTLVLLNKSDLPSRLSQIELAPWVEDKQIIAISVTDGTGIEELEQAIVNLVYSGQVYQGDSVLVDNVRHVHALTQVKIHLEEVLNTIAANMPSDCIVIDLRAAWEKLGEITGDTVSEDIIDQIFSRFCIGK
ncbi:transforming protein p21 ras signature [Lucifera butyrica]|uniref:tRNA modification GTPase MnmE n=1 Tax=Lucifera butyrica TaxID=1351585 RepID=A0A498R7L3_9FIRM|nr:tRNA uridine-5-carboxymethylaminomethyl(34) synthesis GTPase MnmE [Lucifera butyrica]VBB07484.1 transforming protein p21 ras signature [Lucifera butyrica]